jgi:hypothetical protein
MDANKESESGNAIILNPEALSALINRSLLHHYYAASVHILLMVNNSRNFVSIPSGIYVDKTCSMHFQTTVLTKSILPTFHVCYSLAQNKMSEDTFRAKRKKKWFLCPGRNAAELQYISQNMALPTWSSATSKTFAERGKNLRREIWVARKRGRRFENRGVKFTAFS